MIEKKLVRARDVMRKQVPTIDGMATARDAANMMKEHQVSSLIVNKRDENDAYGLISIQDLITEVMIPAREADMVNVYELMTKPIISVSADMDIRYVIRLLHRVNMRRAPVEENGHLVGMVTLTSLVLDHDLF
ncbi:CBS domain-containing protein [Desulfotalea psychrophila]|uniref:CBS domain-containing protein n=1 Tax=Desulfotalea psychrophila (strain LSv54 / DSM 12343) TaxID=177439 RepID=Q6ARE5_DESPS|nr:CBS domain-containing protein [Desulfotalea psychrophila]CAG35079.1 conserved hypothetical protein [Desulfotalea psychrophila LSv54]